MRLPRIGLYLGLRIAANAVSALVIILLIVNLARDLTPIRTMRALDLILGKE
jgi:hypothetical protein